MQFAEGTIFLVSSHEGTADTAAQACSAANKHVIAPLACLFLLPLLPLNFTGPQPTSAAARPACTPVPRDGVHPLQAAPYQPLRRRPGFLWLRLQLLPSPSQALEPAVQSFHQPCSTRGVATGFLAGVAHPCRRRQPGQPSHLPWGLPPRQSCG